MKCVRNVSSGTPTDCLHAAFVSILYVLSLYIFVPKHVRSLPRTNVTQIDARMRAICLTTAATMIYFPMTFCSDLSSSVFDRAPREEGYFLVTDYLSLKVPPTLSSPIPLLHTIALFSGPLTIIVIRARVLAEGGRGWRDAFFKVLVGYEGLPPTLNLFRWPSDKVRDLLVGPITEELCFRAVVVPYLLSAGLSPLKCVFVAPLLFGFAHMHHAINRLREGQPLAITAVNTTFQFSYTYLFGAYATYALLKTNDVTSVIACHSFCNFMGLPMLPSPNEREVYVRRGVVYASYLFGLSVFSFGFVMYGSAAKPAGALAGLTYA